MRILVCDVWSVHNAGDAAILESLLAGLHRLAPRARLQVAAHFPQSCGGLEGVEILPDRLAFDAEALDRQIALRPGEDPALDRLRRAYEEADLVVSTGGYFLNAAPGNPFHWVFLSRLLHFGWARAAGVPVAVVGQSVGPFDGAELRAATRRAFDDLALLTVRDAASWTYLQRSGLGRRAELTADLAVGLAAADAAEVASAMERLGLPRDALGLSVRSYPGTPPGAFAAAARAADRAIEQHGVDVLLIGTTLPPPSLREAERALGNDDAVALEAVHRGMRHADRAALCREGLAPGLLKGVLGTCRALVTTRMHAAILGSTAGVPTGGIAYEYKVTGWFDQLGLPDLVLPLAEMAGPGLAALVDRVLEEGPALRAHLAEVLPEVRARSERNFERLAELLPRDDGVRLTTTEAAPPVSVVIPCKDRLDLLRPVLEGFCAEARRSELELVLVDDGSDPPAAPLVEALGSPDFLRALRHPRNRGRGAALDSGLAAALGEVVIFCDADIVPEPGFVDEHAAFHREHPSELATHLGDLAWGIEPGLFGRLLGARSNPRMAGVRGPLDWPRWYTDNWSFKRRLLADRGLGFDPAFRRWGFEDLALARRLAALGATNTATARGRGSHLKPASFEGFLANFRGSVPNLVHFARSAPDDPTIQDWLAHRFASPQALAAGELLLAALWQRCQELDAGGALAPGPATTRLAIRLSDSAFALGLARGFREEYGGKPPEDLDLAPPEDRAELLALAGPLALVFLAGARADQEALSERLLRGWMSALLAAAGRSELAPELARCVQGVAVAELRADPAR